MAYTYAGQSIEWTVRNHVGQIVRNATVVPDQMVGIDLSEQPNGVYFLEVNATGRTIGNKKLVVQH